MLHQVYCGVMIVFQIQTGIVRLLLRSHILLLFSLLNLECRLLLYRLFPKRGYRLRCRSLKSHGNVLIRRLGRLYLSITSTQVKGDFIQRFVLFFLCGNLLLLSRTFSGSAASGVGAVVFSFAPQEVLNSSGVSPCTLSAFSLRFKKLRLNNLRNQMTVRALR